MCHRKVRYLSTWETLVRGGQLCMLYTTGECTPLPCSKLTSQIKVQRNPSPLFGTRISNGRFYSVADQECRSTHGFFLVPFANHAPSEDFLDTLPSFKDPVNCSYSSQDRFVLLPRSTRTLAKVDLYSCSYSCQTEKSASENGF